MDVFEHARAMLDRFDPFRQLGKCLFDYRHDGHLPRNRDHKSYARASACALAHAVADNAAPEDITT
jgi:hypothetical protein